MDTLKAIFDNNTIIYDSGEISFDEFIDKNEFNYTNFIYLQDLNNDSEEDLIIVSKFAGTGMFSTFTDIFLKKGTTYEHQTINEEDQIVTNFLDIVSYKDKNYIFTTTQSIDNIIEWNEDGFKVLFDESKFIETDHLNADYSEINKRIYDIYNIAQIEKELSEKSIDFSNTGYLNEEILTSYFKIKEFISIEDKESLSNMVSFPIIYTKDNKDYKVYNRQDFIAQYEFIITDSIKEIVEHSNYEDIFSSWRGAMIDGGVIWFTTTIYAINGSLK